MTGGMYLLCGGFKGQYAEEKGDPSRIPPTCKNSREIGLNLKDMKLIC